MSVDGPNVIVGFGQQVAVAAPKARNMKARGKREAQRNASPLVTTNNFNRALKERNTNVDYFALSELHGHCARLPGATRNGREALKERNNRRWYFALSVLC